MSATWFEGSGGAGDRVDLSELLDAVVVDALCRVVGAGALVSVGLSRDAGALSVTVTADGRWRRLWVREADELVEFLSGAEQAVLDVLGANPSPAPVASGGRRRRQKDA